MVAMALALPAPSARPVRRLRSVPLRDPVVPEPGGRPVATARTFVPRP